MAKDVSLSMFWGKADRLDASYWHPAILHMADVGAVAYELVAGGRLPESVTTTILSGDISVEDIAFMISTHDLGKISPGFQNKVPSLSEKIERSHFSIDNDTAHDRVFSALGADYYSRRGVDREVSRSLVAVLSAHHGTFHTLKQQTSVMRHGGPWWESARNNVFDTLAQTIGADFSRFPTTPDDKWLMLIAGLTILSDWIGSSEEHFPFAPDTPLDDVYFSSSRARARAALDAIGFVPNASFIARGFEQMWGFSPNSMQAALVKITEQLQEPSLVVIEAPTGSGKTEAALYAIEAQLESLGLGGVYFGLPTQATSNQMFGRLALWIERSPAATKGSPSLQLLHSGRLYSPEYREARFRPMFDSRDTSASNTAAAWFYGKKRGLLAPFGVGTVDQAMMGALRSKYFPLRLLGLAGKVVVIDEVHAYDAFMSGIIERLLQWLRCLGASVILLSATLPSRTRVRLVSAWRGEPSILEASAWPRITVASRASSSVHAIEHTAEMNRRMNIRWLTPSGPSIEYVADALAESVREGCVAWVLNTVADAQAAYQALISRGYSPEECVLVHARFIRSDRAALETRILNALSADSDRPNRFTVVSTQIIEQSLDIDVDLMVSSIAPIDLLMQRAGRVHRHSQRDPFRPHAFREPTLWVVGRTKDASVGDYGSNGYVYHPHLLLRTEISLSDRSRWLLPSDTDELVESVYDTRRPPQELSVEIVDAWQATENDLQRELSEAGLSGNRNLVPPPCIDPDEEDSFLDDIRDFVLADPDLEPHRHPDSLARTRDIGPSLTVVCLERRDGLVVIPERLDNVGVSIDLSSSRPLNDKVKRALGERIVEIRQMRVISALKHVETPPAFLSSPSFRFTKPIFFDSDGFAVFEGVSLKLDSALGLVITSGGDSRDEH